MEKLHLLENESTQVTWKCLWAGRHKRLYIFLKNSVSGKELQEIFLQLGKCPRNPLLGSAKGKIEPTACQALLPGFMCVSRRGKCSCVLGWCLQMLWDSQVSWFVVDILQYWFGFSLKSPDPRTTWLCENTAVIQIDKEGFIAVG